MRRCSNAPLYFLLEVSNFYFMSRYEQKQSVDALNVEKGIASESRMRIANGSNRYY